MFTHIFVGTNDVAAARAFYDPVMAALGHGEPEVIRGGHGIAYRTGGFSLVIAKPLDGEIATVGNGGTIGLSAPSPAAIDAAHAAGLAAGGTDIGAPGPRSYKPGMAAYGGYLRDPDGNKLCFWHV